MKILWVVSSEDIQKAKAFIKRYHDNAFVRARIKKNLAKNKSRVTKAAFWRNLVMCLVTTQQRSGPNSLVTRFLNSDSFLLDYSLCESKPRIESAAVKALAKYRLRRSNVLANEIKGNLIRLEHHWKEMSKQLDELRLKQNAGTERSVAAYFQGEFKGIGPKQSRNLLQSLGLTRYEIPLDSRIIKWLNSFGFPVRLTAQGLSDEHYYNFISNGIQHLCRKSNIYPCVLDAAIFSSFDKAEWIEKSIR